MTIAAISGSLKDSGTECTKHTACIRLKSFKGDDYIHLSFGALSFPRIFDSSISFAIVNIYLIARLVHMLNVTDIVTYLKKERSREEEQRTLNTAKNSDGRLRRIESKTFSRDIRIIVSVMLRLILLA